MLKHLFAMLSISACLVATGNAINEKQLLVEASPTVAVADQILTERIRLWLNREAETSWTPNRKEALAAVSLIRSDRGQKEILAIAPSGVSMKPSLQRIERSRFQVFGLVIAGRRHLFVDATPLESDMPELWLTDCISREVFDGGHAYWWVLVRADSLEITRCGRRP
jgi:hypothetical protein